MADLRYGKHAFSAQDSNHHPNMLQTKANIALEGMWVQSCSELDLQPTQCEDRVLDGPASGEKGSKGSN